MYMYSSTASSSTATQHNKPQCSTGALWHPVLCRLGQTAHSHYTNGGTYKEATRK